MGKCKRPRMSHWLHRMSALAVAGAGTLAMPAGAHAQTSCVQTVVANVVALDQPFFWNRLGAVQPQGMMYALERDIVPIDALQGIEAGNVMLREDKRPRPIVLRMSVGQCLQINFTNLLDRTRRDEEQPATRTASIQVLGLQLVYSIDDAGLNVGANATSGLVEPGGSITYTLYAEREGTHMLYSGAAMTGGEGDGGSIPSGLFGAVNVEPANSEWYRSQVTEAELSMATVGWTPGADGVLDDDPLTLYVDETEDNQPIIDYDAVYPYGHEFVGLPILSILDEYSEIVHTDINAIITGPDRGQFDEGIYPDVGVAPNRRQSFREFSAIFHDEIGAVQAFPEIFEDPVLSHTLHCCRDGFAINYGTGGIGAEIIANRINVGPMWNCNECKYEEFFLSSWTVGDPAMVVDIPANADLDGDGAVDPGPKATKALYPADPSNVFHSYINDHVKIRNVHVGPKEHHIFHLHAHQWLNTPDEDESSYLDSQAIGPGSEYTYDITWEGSGNRNNTPGDAIFHCHFYPHFAQGMWALWRNHDTFETGTVLDADGIPVYGARALPDGEIVAGTPIPALVPIPGLPMAPMPTDELPGYPFWIAGSPGHRPPTPPLDIIDDGGLPRHVVIDDGLQVEANGAITRVSADFLDLNSGGITEFPALNRLDFSKFNVTMNALELPEDGTVLEQNAMAFHATAGGFVDTYVQPTDGSLMSQAGSYKVNGRAPQMGAPFADPCSFFDYGSRADDIIEPRVYKAAIIQIDAKYNKAGWHFPQHRMLALWEDVASLMDGSKPPEPLFFRANTSDCIEYQHTNLVPSEYALDDFQVQTPTDVLGQHIHLVKFDVTSSDGSANGFNYEDGTFSPGEVRERIIAINEFQKDLTGGGLKTIAGGLRTLAPVQHPYFGGELGLGARTTVQRWFADDVFNMTQQDRTLRTVFTHDHLAPSTNQQAGLYASLVVEPDTSVWRVNDSTGTLMGTRADGGPTSWEAIIETADPADSYREFLFQVGDFHLAYTKDADLSVKQFDTGLKDAKGDPIMAPGIADPANAINPPGLQEVGLPFLLQRPVECPGGVPPPCPEGVSADDPGTMLVNYRNEPIPLRVRDPVTNTQAPGVAGDLAHVFRSNVERADPDFNEQPDFYPALTPGVLDGDPFTPLMRVAEGDKVQIRVQVGSTEEGHNMSLHGIKWLFEPSAVNSGYKNSQMMGLSEHFEFVIPYAASVEGGHGFEDYLYKLGASVDDLWNGTWGIMRTYKRPPKSLVALPNNAKGKLKIVNSQYFRGVCPKYRSYDPRARKLSITAILAQDALPGGALVYNSRETNGGPLTDPTAILYVQSSDIDEKTGRLKAGVPVEPLVIRINAGDCLDITIDNRLPVDQDAPDLAGFSTLPMIVDDFNANQVKPSTTVGLHPQLLDLNMDKSDGTNVGLNKVQTVKPGQKGGPGRYRWYAGTNIICQASSTEPECDEKPEGYRVAVPVEFGAIALSPADPIKQASKGAVGILIVEPQGATWQVDADTRTAATVTLADGSTFREFALVFQNDLNLRCTGCGIGPGDDDAGPAADADAVPNLADSEDPEDSGQKALNYKTEPMWLRLGFAPNQDLEGTRTLDFTNALSNSQVGGDPETPVFTAEAGTPVRFRVVHPGGKARNNVFTLSGHIWQEEPWTHASTVIGDNPNSEWKGAQTLGPFSHYNFVLVNGAGGKFAVPGDYVFRDLASFMFDGGMWGILRVEENN